MNTVNTVQIKLLGDDEDNDLHAAHPGHSSYSIGLNGKDPEIMLVDYRRDAPRDIREILTLLRQIAAETG